jgi:hypothetical protein
MSRCQQKTPAMETLHQHHVDPHHLLRHLHQQKTTLSYLNTETQTRWTYMARQRSRLFLLAKPDDDDETSRYQDLLAISLK